MTYQRSHADALAALADPTRRAIIERLRLGAVPVGVLAEGLPVSRPAVSQHLKVLGDAGLLSVEARGTRRFYSIDTAGLAALRDYLDRLWDGALASYAAHVRQKENPS